MFVCVMCMLYVMCLGNKRKKQKYIFQETHEFMNKIRSQTPSTRGGKIIVLNSLALKKLPQCLLKLILLEKQTSAFSKGAGLGCGQCSTTSNFKSSWKHYLSNLL